MTRAVAFAAAVLALAFAPSAVAEQPLRVLSLDQCADQFALGLAVPEDVLFLSPRADDPDSHLRARAAGHRRVRPTLEAALAARPDVVIRYWGGDPRLMRALDDRGVTILQIEDATDLEGVRRNVSGAGRVLGRSRQAEALLADMDRRLAVPSAPSGSALYLTAGGFTAGAGTLIDALMRAAGFSNLAPGPGFGPVSVERLILQPPARLVLGFFEAARADWRGAGRHPAVGRLIHNRPVSRVEGAVAGCPAWFVGEAVEQMRTEAP